MKKLKRAEYQQQLERAQQQLDRALHVRMIKRAEKDDQDYNALLSKIQEGDTLDKEMGRNIASRKDTAQRRKEQLYKRWSLRVFDPMQRQVSKQLGQRSVSDIEKRRAGMLDDYLQATNKGQGLFRDIIIESDYNPFCARADTIKIDTQKINVDDPLKTDLLKVVYRAASQPLLPSPVIGRVSVLRGWLAR